ncbi:HD family phosphohydrolase [Tepiditoga spiralis]|uniref:HD family phosphohydrolase n=1 Tax=Tepiditoga spiralis TaxID=2108365 RepID=A0A7G1G9B4_9BACT|nr:HD-GYP domain-containing protein [Tepiditoga spiralis]BBE32076.1 HD family phosphohydrolase [Tepiditoga spiralis]
MIFKDVDKLETWKYILASDIPSLKLKKGTIIDSSNKYLLLKNGIFTVPVLKNRAADVAVIDEKKVEKSYMDMKDLWKKLDSEDKVIDKKVEDMSEEITESVLKNFKEVLYLPLKKLKDYDEYTYTHSLNVGMVASLIGAEFGLDKKELKNLTLAGLLHDVGKSKIKYEILNAPRRLTTEEFNEIKKHVVYGKELCIKNHILDEDLIDGILHHHERYDGKGYVEGMKEKNISLFARLLTISDVFDALTSKRVYKKSWNYYRVISHIIQNSNKMFDPELVTLLIKIFGLYPPGTIVKLNDFRVGTVVASQKGNDIQPIVQIEDKVIDLKSEKKYIVDVVDEVENYEENI